MYSRPPVQSTTMTVASTAALIFGAIDAINTYILVGSGFAVEVNPIMKFAMDSGGWPAFFCVKAVLTLLGLFSLVLMRRYTIAKVVMVCLAIGYGALNIYQFRMMTHFAEVFARCLS